MPRKKKEKKVEEPAAVEETVAEEAVEEAAEVEEVEEVAEEEAVEETEEAEESSGVSVDAVEFEHAHVVEVLNDGRHFADKVHCKMSDATTKHVPRRLFEEAGYSLPEYTDLKDQED